jgi:hypothetical protein
MAEEEADLPPDPYIEGETNKIKKQFESGIVIMLIFMVGTIALALIGSVQWELVAVLFSMIIGLATFSRMILATIILTLK